MAMNNVLLFASSSDKTVKVWDATSRQCIQTFNDHIDQVSSLHPYHYPSCLTCKHFMILLNLFALNDNKLSSMSACSTSNLSIVSTDVLVDIIEHSTHLSYMRLCGWTSVDWITSVLLTPRSLLTREEYLSFYKKKMCSRNPVYTWTRYRWHHCFVYDMHMVCQSWVQFGCCL